MIVMIWMVKEVIAVLICSLMLNVVLFSHVFYCTYKIDYFGVGIAIVLGGANSGQASIKRHDLACDAESPLLKIVRI